MHALLKESEPIAILLIEAGFPCDKSYEETRPSPCHMCELCATELMHYCQDMVEAHVDVNPEYMCQEHDFKTALKLIENRQTNVT